MFLSEDQILPARQAPGFLLRSLEGPPDADARKERLDISNKVFVGNLSFDVTRDELIEAFSGGGQGGGRKASHRSGDRPSPRLRLRGVRGRRHRAEVHRLDERPRPQGPSAAGERGREPAAASRRQGGPGGPRTVLGARDGGGYRGGARRSYVLRRRPTSATSIRRSSEPTALQDEAPAADAACAGASAASTDRVTAPSALTPPPSRREDVGRRAPRRRRGRSLPLAGRRRGRRGRGLWAAEQEQPPAGHLDAVARARAPSRRGCARSSPSALVSAARLRRRAATSTRSARARRSSRCSTCARAATAPTASCSIRPRWRGDATCALDWYYPSPDGRLLAYGLSEGGSEKSTLRVRDVATRHATSADVIPYTRACSLEWLPDGSGFYYTRYPEPGTVPAGEENYHRRVFVHRLGGDWREDPLVFGADRPPEDWPNVHLSPDGRWLARDRVAGLDAHRRLPARPAAGPVRTDRGRGRRRGLRRRRAQRPPLPPRPTSVPRASGWCAVPLEHPASRALARAAPRSGGRARGRGRGRRDAIVAVRLREASSRLTLHDARRRASDGGRRCPSSAAWPASPAEWDGDEAFFGFSSYTVPPDRLSPRPARRGASRSSGQRVEADVDASALHASGSCATPRGTARRVSMFLVARERTAPTTARAPPCSPATAGST